MSSSTVVSSKIFFKRWKATSVYSVELDLFSSTKRRQERVLSFLGTTKSKLKVFNLDRTRFLNLTKCSHPTQTRQRFSMKFSLLCIQRCRATTAVLWPTVKLEAVRLSRWLVMTRAQAYTSQLWTKYIVSLNKGKHATLKSPLVLLKFTTNKFEICSSKIKLTIHLSFWKVQMADFTVNKSEERSLQRIKF